MCIMLLFFSLCLMDPFPLAWILQWFCYCIKDLLINPIPIAKHNRQHAGTRTRTRTRIHTQLTFHSSFCPALGSNSVSFSRKALNKRSRLARHGYVPSGNITHKGDNNDKDDDNDMAAQRPCSAVTTNAVTWPLPAGRLLAVTWPTRLFAWRDRRQCVTCAENHHTY